jgi:hypothetical protein
VRADIAPRRALLGALVLTAIAVAALALRATRLTIANDGISLAFPWTAAATPAVCGLTMATLAILCRTWRVRILLAAVALAIIGAAAATLSFRIVAGPGGLRVRSLFSSTSVGWGDVSRVDTAEGEIAITAVDGRRILLSTRALSSDWRQALERTIARRLRERGHAAPTPERPR